MTAFRRKLERLSHPQPGLGQRAARELDPGDPRAPEPASEHDARLQGLRALIRDAMRSSKAAPASAPHEPPRWQEIPGEEQRTEQGAMHVLDRWLAPDHRHGHSPVARAVRVQGAELAKLALDPYLVGVDAERMLMIDTETTGLSGGTGTVPFLVGLAWFEEGSWRLEQLLVKGFGQEAPVLARLAERLSWASCVVSYNGKAFDWPLLRTRFVLNRVRVPELPAHLDLLHCVRRVFKPRLGAVRLVDVEQHVLGFHRQDDVDSAAIPGLYTAFLRGADAQTMIPVIEHNAYDLIALAALIGEMAEHFHSLRPEDDPRDHLAFAKVAARAGDEQRAIGFARAAADFGAEPAVVLEALRLQATLARRRGDPSSAIDALQRALTVASDPEDVAEIHFALAKLYEHALRDLDQAYEHASASVLAEGTAAHQHRLARLARKRGARDARSMSNH